MTQLTTVAGAILAGGQAKRMGGLDKAHLQVGGTTMVARALGVLAPHCQAVALIGREQAPPPLIAIEDGAPGHQGPLAGILAALTWSPAPFVVVVPCDAPFLPDDLVPRLMAAMDNVDVVIGATDLQDHPTIGLWRTAIKDDLRQAFDAGIRSIRAFAYARPHAQVAWHEAGRDPFMNINRPEDLARAERLA